MGRDFTSRDTWKGKEICCSVYKGLNGLKSRTTSCFSDSEAPRSGEPQAHASVLYQEKFVNQSSEKFW